MTRPLDEKHKIKTNPWKLWYILTLLLQQSLTPPAAMSSSPINSFYLLNKALTLTSDNFHSIFPPAPPPFILFLPQVALTWNCHMAHLYCVHIHSFSSDWKRPLWVSEHALFWFMCLLSRDLPLQFFGKSFHFYSYFCFMVSVLSFSMWFLYL